MEAVLLLPPAKRYEHLIEVVTTLVHAVSWLLCFFLPNPPKHCGQI